MELPKLISDGMVLQRNTSLKLWGKGSPEEKVSINFQEKTYEGITNHKGNWEVMLPPLEAGGPYDMQIQGETEVVLHEVYVGEVWLCSGQSNMELPVCRVKDEFKEELETCENPMIRQFTVPQVYNFIEPQQDLSGGGWQGVDKETVMDFTATGYFFGKALYEKYQVPIGLINTGVGGTPVEAWMKEDLLEDQKAMLEELDLLRKPDYISTIIKADERRSNEWHKKIEEQDQSLRKQNWFKGTEGSWAPITLPCDWKETTIGPLVGAVWFKKEIEVPKEMTGCKVRLELGAIVDHDEVYINGQKVGETTYCYPPRKYDLAAGVLKEGKNIIMMRVLSYRGQGGFVKEKPYELWAGEQVIDLKGEWAYQITVLMDVLQDQTFFQYKPTGLYNGMISPLLNYVVKGVIWYQGESNAEAYEIYGELFKRMIKSWREKWHQEKLPFLYVQLANFMRSFPYPTESQWAALRNEQLKALELEKTGMAVITDVGEWNDLHPIDKKTVGQRLALLAEHIAYGELEVISEGPIFKSAKLEGNRVVISFEEIGSGLITKNNEALKHFAISPDHKQFIWAKAKIVGNKVIVWHEAIKEPKEVRYAWADNPETANLYNREGLPASCFKVNLK